MMLNVILGGVIVYGEVLESGNGMENHGTQYTAQDERAAAQAQQRERMALYYQDSNPEISGTSVGNDDVSTIDSAAHEIEYLGYFKITAYTAGKESTGKSLGDPAYGITASGETVKDDLTIAADWLVLPVGTWVMIEGIGERQVQDKGGAIKGEHIDVYMKNLSDALEFGIQQRKVWIINKES